MAAIGEETVTIEGLARTVDDLTREMHDGFEAVNERVGGLEDAVKENSRKVDKLLDHFGIAP